MRKIATILGVTALLAALLVPAAVVLAQDTVVSIDAPAVVDPGSDFTAQVDIVDVENLDTAQYEIVFDSTVLQLDNVTAGNVGGTAIPVDIANPIAAGRVRIVQNVPGLTGVDGDGYLAELEFSVVGDPGDVSAIDLQNGLLGDNLAQQIPATWVDGAVTVSGAAPPPGDVVVSIDVDALVAPDSDFTADVDIVNVENLDSAQYEVVFDDTVLRLDDVTDGTVDGTAIPVDIWNPIAAGRVRIVQNVPGLAGVDGDGTLAVLQFHVIGDVGDESDIDLQNGLLGDNAGVEIDATWVDGSVMVIGEPPPGALVVSIDAPPEVPPNSDFTADVDIVNVENLDSAAYDVVFDDTVLRLDDVTDGTIDGTAIPVDIWNLVDGRVTIVQNVPGLAGVTGDGTLAELEFHVIGDVGDSSAIDLQNGMLGDNVGVEIDDAFWVDGAVTVGVPPPTEFEQTFVGTLAEGVRAYICTIPGGATELDISMSTAAPPGADMDLEFYKGPTFVIGEGGQIDSASPGTFSYAGDTFGYSGWSGVGGDPGEEYITSLGPLTQSYDLKVYAYEAGTYTVDVFYMMPGPDSDPPTIDIDAPDGTVGVPATITVSATDPSGVVWIYFGVWPDEYEFTGTEADWFNAWLMASGPGGEVSLTFTPLAHMVDGYHVAAWAGDMVGNFTPDGDPVIVDWAVT